MHHVVIIGCGFGGLEAIKVLGRAPASLGLRVTVLDRSNHHLFQPLLYQVATAGLSAPSIAAPIRHIAARYPNVTVLLQDVVGIDPGRREVRTATGEAFAYDSLIVASGATHSYFGNDGWAAHAPGLKTLADAMAIRRRVLYAFELAERDPDQAAQWLTFVVIGGGPTGVEMAGTMAEIAHQTLRDEFRRIKPSSARVILVEAADRILSAYPEDLSSSALAQLRELGVDVLLGGRVTAIDGEGVTVGDRPIAARTVVWAAGVQASPLGRLLGVTTDRAGRVPVNATLTLDAWPEIAVIGDLAAAESDGRPVPGVSPAAKQMGRRVARNLIRARQQRPAEPFRYIDYGSMATIGRKRAIAMIGPFKLRGLPAWLLWLFAHLYFLIGFRNRLIVMADWAWAYFSFTRSARVVWDAPPDTSTAEPSATEPTRAAPVATDPGH